MADIDVHVRMNDMFQLKSVVEEQIITSEELAPAAGSQIWVNR